MQPAPEDGRAHFEIRNTGTPAGTPAGLHADAPAHHFGTDIYRLAVSVEGAGWAAQLQNALAVVPFSETLTAPVFVEHAENAAATAVVTLRVGSECDPAAAVTASSTVRR